MDFEEVKLVKRISKARSSGKFDDLILCCRRLAEYYVKNGRYDDALIAFKDELDACQRSKNEKDIAHAHRMIGEACSALGMFEESLEHVNKYLEYAVNEVDVIEEQRAYATIGRTYFCWADDMKQRESPVECAKELPMLLKQCRKAYLKSLSICEQELKSIGHREKNEMKARLHLNLGLAYEIEGELTEADKFIHRSVMICKKEQLFEDLHRSLLSLALIKSRSEDFAAALKATDEAIETAKKLDNKAEATVLALARKADVYFAMCNYPGAQTVLKKAYKLKSPIADDRREVESALKRAVVLCNLEKDLLVTKPDMLSDRKSIYEKLGDACCAVKNFKHAIKCYLSMLECAEALGETGKQLLPCYVSLSQTYRDDKNYILALEYARKELEISKSIPYEAAKTYLNIGEILEMKGASFAEVSDEYLSALANAKEAGTDKLQVAILKSLAALQKAHGRMQAAEKTERDLEEIQVIDSSSDSDSDKNPEEDVNLSELSASDDDLPRAARNTFRVTRNEKGETPLHVAAIRGDVARARRLLSMGHPVKERDLAGWTPLHEAANHGHLDMVELLVEAGADVNDPGGKDCGGVTPLHDSACCGHFEIIRYLIDHGALVTVLTNDGETPLDCLNGWRRRVEDLDPESEKIFEALAKDLRGSLVAAGIQKTESVRPQIVTKPRRREPVRLNDRAIGRLGDLRRNLDVEETDRWRSRSVSPVSSEESPFVTDDIQKVNKENRPPQCKQSVFDYRTAMKAIRKRPLPLELPKPLSDGPLVDAEGYVDDWLDDDIGAAQNHKKPKRKLADLIETSRLRSTVVQVEEPPSDPESAEVTVSPEDGASRKKSRLQPAVSEPIEVLFEAPNTIDTSFELPCVSPPSSSVSTFFASTTKVRVRVGEHLLLIPVNSNRVDDLTVGWLATETARRYYTLEGREPKLQLATKDGAILDPSDPASLAIGEELCGKILSWKCIPLCERYRYICSADHVEDESGWCGGSKLKYVPSIATKLDGLGASGELSLKNLSLDECELKAVLLTIKSEARIQTLDLSGNLLGDDGLAFLTEALGSCAVQHLILRCTNISASGIRQLSNSLPSMRREFVDNLRSLDVSFNPIGEDGTNICRQMATSLPNLTTLKTDHCQAPC